MALRGNGGRAITDVLRVWTPGQYLLSNGSCVFATGIVVRDDDCVCVADRDLTHQRTLAGVAIATATEDNVQFPLDMRANGSQHCLKGVRRVRVVDIDRRA